MHHAVVAQVRAHVEARIQRYAYDIAAVVDADAAALDVSGKGAEILHAFFPGPQERVRDLVARQIRTAHRLAQIVKPDHEVSETVSGAAQITEVDHRAFLPQDRVQRLQIEEIRKIER